MYGANGVRSSIQGRDVIDQKKLVTTHEVTALTSRSRSKLYTMRHAGDFPQLAATCTKGRFCWVAQVAELPFARTGRMLSAERPIPAVQLLRANGCKTDFETPDEFYWKANASRMLPE
jgi:predicted DNA-binding transcriptional regulator AlpA